MRENNVFIIYILLLLSVFIMCSCIQESKKAMPLEENTTSYIETSINIQSNGETVSNTEYSHNDDIKVNKATEEIAEISDYKYKALLEKYIAYIKKEHKELLGNENQCKICLQDIYADDIPEMMIRILYESGYECEYFFTMGENDDIIYMGSVPHSEESKLYSDGYDNFIISHGIIENDIQYSMIYKLDTEIPQKMLIIPDLSEYTNSSAHEFILHTQMYFCRFDEYLDIDNDVPAEVHAEDFYYEDTETYEAYMLSPEILDLTDTQLSEYISPYNTITHDLYLVKREEYLAVKDKLYNMMTELDIVPEIDSGWIETENIDIWLKGV